MSVNPSTSRSPHELPSSSPGDEFFDQPHMPRISRRALLLGVLGAGAALLIGNRMLGNDDSDGLAQAEPTYEPNTGSKPFNPEVKIRDHAVEFGDADPTEHEESTVNQLRRVAPVFTLVHTVKSGETVDQLASRYYSSPVNGKTTEEQTSDIAHKALTAANELNEDGDINVGQVLYIPISEPVAIKKDGKTTAEIAALWGFSVESIEAVNAGREQDPKHDGLEDWLYLPAQQMPSLADRERVYVLERTEDGPTTYFGIAKELGTGLSTLIGRNKPDPAHLEYGHVLVASTESLDTTTTTAQPTTTTTIAPKHPKDPTPKDPGDGDGVTPEDLIKQRTWTGEIVRTDQTDKLEQNISIERIEEIVLTREGYDAWLKTIDAKTYVSVFEEAGTVWTEKGILDDPQYFIIHHTAQGVEPGVTGMERLTNSIKNNRLSVQWSINQESETYQLVTNPKIACSHAYEVNDKATGVELVTDMTRAQGSVTTEQLTNAMYLAYYVVTDIYGKDATGDLKEIVVGHREINDRLGVGTEGKPDFFEGAMDMFRAKLSEFAHEMA